MSFSFFVDIDECQGATHGCSQLCTNTVGSYMCGCSAGFQLDGNGRQCSGESSAKIMKSTRNVLCFFLLIHRY